MHAGGAWEEIRARLLKVNQIWVPFHDELYLVPSAAISPPPEPAPIEGEVRVGGRYNQGCIYRAEYLAKERRDGSYSADSV
jgi:hypothetical protein